MQIWSVPIPSLDRGSDDFLRLSLTFYSVHDLWPAMIISPWKASLFCTRKCSDLDCWQVFVECGARSTCVLPNATLRSLVDIRSRTHGNCHGLFWQNVCFTVSLGVTREICRFQSDYIVFVFAYNEREVIVLEWSQIPSFYVPVYVVGWVGLLPGAICFAINLCRYLYFF